MGLKRWVELTKDCGKIKQKTVGLLVDTIREAVPMSRSESQNILLLGSKKSWIRLIVPKAHDPIRISG